MKTLILVLFLGLTACGKKAAEYKCEEVPQLDTTKPGILVIGDSISLGYTPYLREALTSNYDVVHNPCNGRNTRYDLQQDAGWFRMRGQWEAITFNHGIWDETHTSDFFRYTSHEEYERNLHLIAQRVKAHTAHPLFILTTEIPIYDPADILERNDIALRVMQEEGIPVHDLYSVSTGAAHPYHLSPTNVHFTEEGSQILADSILETLDTVYGIY